MAFSSCISNDDDSSSQLKSGVNLSRIDKSIRPQDDFYRHVNGNWLNTFEIPDDKSNYGTFTELQEKAKKDIHEIIHSSLSENHIEGSDSQKIADLYKSYMDEEYIENSSTRYLEPELDRINQISNLTDLSSYMAYADIVSSSPFGIYVSVDQKNPDQYIMYISQSGLSLPDRDYYLEESENMKKYRKQYKNYISQIFSFTGLEEPRKAAESILELETKIARIQWEREENRDPKKTYNLRTIEDLNKNQANIDWQSWLKSLAIEDYDTFVVRQPDYLDSLNKMIPTISLDRWKTYFKWQILNSFSPYLSKEFQDAHFNFYKKVLSGVSEEEPRWQRAVSLVNRSIGELVGKAYVKKYFDSKSKEKMQDLVDNLKESYAISIQGLGWMSKKTKKEALKKLDKFRSKIGFPNEWKTYENLEINSQKLFHNIKNIRLFKFQENTSKLGKKINREEWKMNPQTVNAYYSPLTNEIVFPAAILQAPFFNFSADDAINYGAIGAVIGHEMGHGFDDKGSQFDGNGMLRDWWEKSDRDNFNERTRMLVEQYNNYTVVDGTKVNGEFTLGENIGDAAGVVIAFKAYQLSKKNKKDIKIDGLTGDQRFFFGWATIWARLYRDAELLQRIKTDPHAPSEFRCNGPLVNMPEFVKTFDVKENDGMYKSPEKQIKIW